MKHIILWIVGLLLCGQVRAAEIDLTFQHLNHKGWNVSNGISGAVVSITQTTDGTLWLASGYGLTRFDGIRFVRYDGPAGQPFESNNVRTVAASVDGGLWIGFTFGGISFLKNGRVLHYGEREGLPVASVNDIVTDPMGVTYATTTQGLFGLLAGRWERIAIDTTDPGARVSGAAVDHAGTLWVVTDTALWARALKANSFREVAKHANSSQLRLSIAIGPDGVLWIPNFGRDGELTRVDPLTDSLSSGIREFSVHVKNMGVVFDREGYLWTGGSKELRRFATSTLTDDLGDLARVTDSFSSADGLTGEVTSFFEDREGNIWVGTPGGLDRFSSSNFLRISQKPFSTDGIGGAMVAGDAGTLWVSGDSNQADGKFLILEIRHARVVSQNPATPATSAYRSPQGDIWFGAISGIARLQNGHLVSTTLPANGEVQAMVQDRSGAMWVSLVRKGVFRLADGQWSLNGGLPSLPHLPAIVETADAQGTLWFGYTGNQIARVDGGNVTLFSATDGLNVGNVTAITARGPHLWIAGEHGLERFDGMRFIPVSADSVRLLTGISGIVELEGGDVWLNGLAGIVHIPRAELERAESDATYRVHCEVFDQLDGMTGYARQLRPTPTAIEGTDGRLWFGLQNGLVSIDPAHIKRNPRPPPVTIWSINAEGIQYAAVQPPSLPVHTTNVRIEYTAGSLTIPERVRFRYRLEGLDRDWQDAGDRREAVYTNLGPGRYTFHVIAANNDGVWNTIGASLPFIIAPAFYQTPWFYGLCALLCLGLLQILYMMRIRQVSAQVRGRLEERLAERERIARDLHDTLLQSVQGLILRLRAAVKQERPGGLIEQGLERADEVLAEARDRVKHLRSSPNGDQDLIQGLLTLGQELATEQTAQFRSTTAGTPRDLHPIICEEALFIAREALTNAFRHANARHIEAELSYGEEELRLIIRDDGKGIDAGVLRHGGQDEHWGLLGMRERAKKIRATLTIWSKPDAGTEVDLRVPAHLAYRSQESAPFRWWRRLRLSDTQD